LSEAEDLRLALSNGTGAGGSAAGTRKCPDVFVEIVIHGQFLAGLDGAQAHVEYMTSHDAAHQIGIAAVIDDLGPTAAHSAIEGPIGVDGEQIGVVAIATNLSLFSVQALAGVLDHFTIGRNTFTGEHSITMNPGAPDQELKTGEFLSDFRGFD
jgi:hypothetical protein